MKNTSQMTNNFRAIVFVACITLVWGCSSKIDALVPRPIEVLSPNTYIADLVEGYIAAETIIQGSVTTSDSCGNFYQTMVIQDQFGALELRFSFYDSFSLYKPGEIVSVQLQGKTLKKENGILTVNVGSLYLTSQSVKRQGVVAPITPKKLTILEIDASEIGFLVEISGGEFVNGAKDGWGGEQKYTVGKQSITVYTSYYASYASKILPLGKVSLVGIVTVYGGKFQLKLSSPDDCREED